MPVVIREIYGLKVLDCERLHATIGLDACRDNFTNAKCLACRGCPVGAELTGNVQQPRNALAWKECLRCGSRARRLIGRALCPSCYNRQREVLIDKNSKGQHPRVSAERLHKFSALITADEATCTRAAEQQIPLFSATRYTPTTVWFTGLVTGFDELQRLIALLIPGGKIEDFEGLA